MTLPPHLHPINFDQGATYSKLLQFTGFQSLPKELRVDIWRHALQRQRFIHVRIVADAAASIEIQKIDCAAKRSLDIAVIRGTHLLSQLFHVNNESRVEALKFYRIHLPIHSRIGHEPGEVSKRDGILHINPEWDVLWISRTYHARKAFIPFLHQLKYVYDPRRIGLLNLAFEGNDLTFCDLRASEFDPVMWSSFVETLLQLRQIWIVCLTYVGRQINNLSVAYQLGMPVPWFNRSVPLMSTPVTFERLLCDPRRIEADLKYVPEVGSKRQVLEHWLQLLREWTPSPPPSSSFAPSKTRAARPAYHILHAYKPTWSSHDDLITSRSRATTWLQETEDQWDGFVGDNNDVSTSTWPLERKAWRVDWHEDLDQAVRPAFGFWLFPLEAFGRFVDDGDGDGRFLVAEEEDRPGRRDIVKDMRSHWPELLLSCFQ